MRRTKNRARRAKDEKQRLRPQRMEKQKARRVNKAERTKMTEGKKEQRVGTRERITEPRRTGKH